MSVATPTPPDEMSLAAARAYLRRRRVLLSLAAVVTVGVLAWGAQVELARSARLEVCNAQKQTTELVVDVERTFADLVQVRAHGKLPWLVPPARGDVVVGEHGVYLVGEGRVQLLEPSCAEAVQ